MRFICLALALLLIFPCCAAAEDNGEDEPETMLSRMTLRDKVSQMMIASFRAWKEMPETEGAEEPPAVNMTELNDEVREMVARDHFGGILLFSENFADAEQTLRLISDLQITNQSGGGVPIWVFCSWFPTVTHLD